MRRLVVRVAPTALVVVVGIAGAWGALLLAGPRTYDVGPFRVDLFARPGPGVTEIALPPFGRVRADTHLSPLRLTATLAEVEAPGFTTALEGGGHTLVREVERDGQDAVGRHVRRALAVCLVGAAALGVAVYRRRWRRVAAATLAGVLVFAGGTGAAYTTFRPEAFLEPTFTGSLTLAPRLLGPIREATGQIADFRAELRRLVAGAVRAYGVVAAQPPSTSRVVALHIADIHAQPVGMDLAQELAQTFEVDLVLDAGDITSFNTPLEQTILERIREFDVPYVFVRGNHDSAATAAQMAALENVRVLEDELETIAGLRVYGVPDPEFTPAQPDRATDAGRAELLAEQGRRTAERIAGLEEPPDVLLVHDDRQAEPVAGLVPVVASGHFHRTQARVIDGTVFLRVGTTGAGGFDPFPGGVAVPLAAQVLYFDGDPLHVVAFDAVHLNPETRELTVRRTLVERLLAGAPTPAPTPTPGP